MISILITVGVTSLYPLEGYPLIINEFSRGAIQWVEIYNPTSNKINLDGWKIRNAFGEDPLWGSIGPHGYLVIVSSRSSFNELFPTFNNSGLIEIQDHTIGSGLNWKNDMLSLIDPDGNISDCVNWGIPDPGWKYSNPFLWNPGISSNSDVIARYPNGKDTDSPVDFRGTSKPTPGSVNLQTSGLDTSTWGKIKALFSGKRRI